MKNIITLILVLLAMVSCKQISAQLIPVSNTIKIDEDDSKDSIILKAAHVVPTKNQYEALKNEYIAFIHFGPNTFTQVEWGNGMEDPKIFDPKKLDTDQWCQAIKSAGMKMVIITVKHHDGFVLWQSRYTKQGIMSSTFQNGKGDVLKELSKSCQKYGLKLGIYLSPADLYQIENKEGLYGNLSEYRDRVIPRPVAGRPFSNKTTFTFNVDDYNEYFLNQLFELLTEYGPIDEVWFDGAHPKRKGGQQYNYLAWRELINELAPKAVIFGKQDIRWCGNESGGTRDTEWNVIPFLEDPDKMNNFEDLTEEELGSREKLYKGKYLHYQQAETNTSIREGWFYRDDTSQKVRSVDDVFDMYERSVGGNTTLLLNIPPNRDGLFSAEDVKVLKEVGQRINDTYTKDLLAHVNVSKELFDNDEASFVLLNEENNTILITTPKPITTNRFLIQEAIKTHGERIEKLLLDAWVSNGWEKISEANNVGYKRILRFPEVTSDKFRIRVLESRLRPAISKISAHYYRTRPPQLSINRNIDGMVSINPKKHEFSWKPHGEDIAGNINTGYMIRYTIDGSKPTKASKLYTESFLMPLGEVNAITEVNNEFGSMSSQVFGIIKKDWKLYNTDSEEKKHEASKAFDADENTYWQSNSSEGNNHYVSIDLGKAYTLNGFSYTPQQEHTNGMIEKGLVKVSKDGKSWQVLEGFRFGNLINDPMTRRHNFKTPTRTRYIRIDTDEIAGGERIATIAELGFY